MSASGSGRRGVRRAAAVGVTCALSVYFGAGCTSARTNLGTTDSACYLALPIASHAIGTQGRLQGVRLVTLSTLRHEAPGLTAHVSSEVPANQNICALAFAGRFTLSSVTKPYGRPVSRVAIVLVTRPSNTVLGTVLLDRLPLRFSHSHIG